MTDNTTAAILLELTADQTVELYNQVAGVRPVTRLGDVLTAQRRLELALERAGARLARVAGERGVFQVVASGESPAVPERAGQRRIAVLVPNPKRRGSASWDRFAMYRDGITMEEYIDAVMTTGLSRKKARKDLYWDRDHGYITIG